MTGDQGTIGGGSSLLGGGGGLNLGGLGGGQPQQFGGGGTSLLGGGGGMPAGGTSALGGGLGGAPIGGGGMLMGGLGGQAQPGMVGGLPQQVGLGGAKQPQTEAEKIEALMPLIVKLTDPDQVRGSVCSVVLRGILVPDSGEMKHIGLVLMLRTWNACRSSNYHRSACESACWSGLSAT